ncbi:hypothetical protein STEG23_017164, partial [Scotinomys teguina]
MEVVAAAPRCQLLLIMLMAAMLLPGMKNLLLLVRRKITRTIELQESIDKELGMTAELSQMPAQSFDTEPHPQLHCVVTPLSLCDLQHPASLLTKDTSYV